MVHLVCLVYEYNLPWLDVDGWCDAALDRSVSQRQRFHNNFVLSIHRFSCTVYASRSDSPYTYLLHFYVYV